MDGLELLVHNLSHSDLVLSINTAALDLKANKVIARPKFSNFHAISEQILNNASAANSDVTMSTSRICSRKHPMATASGDRTVPVGFNLTTCPIEVRDLSTVRFRHDDKSILQQSMSQHSAQHSGIANHNEATAVIDSAYFPLLAVLIPKWLASIEGQREFFDKVIVLVSGRGTPSVQNSGTDNDNSTKCTAELMKLFIELTYPAITVRLLHSDSNLFRYDENIVFVKGQLLPLINEYRDHLVARKAAEWKEHMRVSLSFADGSSARISAINASLRYYRPSYMHFWQLKSFWREQLICEDDIECHSYEEIATEPAMKIADTAFDPLVHAVVQEMARFREEFTAVVQDTDTPNDLSAFWLRKTKKPVLAVLLVQKPGKPFKLYRGTNMEVSMPTGSLCAERNVIGTALSADITLRREDIKIVAVYSASMPAPASQSVTSQSLLQRTGSANSVLERSASYTSTQGAGNGFSQGPGSPQRSNSLSFPPSSPMATQQQTHSSNSYSTNSNPFSGSASGDAFTPVVSAASQSPAGGNSHRWEGSDGDSHHMVMTSASQANTPIGTPSPSSHEHRKRQCSEDSRQGDNRMNMMIDTSLPCSITAIGSLNSGPISSNNANAKSPQLSAKRKIMSMSHQNSVHLTTATATATAPASTSTSSTSSEHSSSAVPTGAASSAVKVESAQADTVRLSAAPALPPMGLRRNPSGATPTTPGAGTGAGSLLQRSSIQALSSSASAKASASAKNNTKTKTVAFSSSSTNLAAGTNSDASEAISSTYSCDGADLSAEGIFGTSGGGASLNGGVPVCLNVGTPVSHVATYMPIETETIIVDKDDLNPLKPCGACNEWLKKIAEVNPQMRVITFTDANCRGVHIEQIDD